MDRTRTTLEVEEEEIDDRSMARAVILGALVGIPLALVVVAVEVLLAGESLGTAFEVALWPALVAGPYLGGFIVLISVAMHRHGGAQVHHLPGAARPPGTTRHAA